MAQQINGTDKVASQVFCAEMLDPTGNEEISLENVMLRFWVSDNPYAYLEHIYDTLQFNVFYPLRKCKVICS